MKGWNWLRQLVLQEVFCRPRLQIERTRTQKLCILSISVELIHYDVHRVDLDACNHVIIRPIASMLSVVCTGLPWSWGDEGLMPALPWSRRKEEWSKVSYYGVKSPRKVPKYRSKWRATSSTKLVNMPPNISWTPRSQNRCIKYQISYWIHTAIHLLIVQ